MSIADALLMTHMAILLLPSSMGKRCHSWSNDRGRSGSTCDFAHSRVFSAMCRLQASGNAVELLGTFEDRSCVYIVMEECRGGDLETLLEVSLRRSGFRLGTEDMLSSVVRCTTQKRCSNRRLQSSAFQRSP